MGTPHARPGRPEVWIGGALGTRPISARVGAGLVLGLLGLCWGATYAVGGAGGVAPHWFYLPVLVAGSRFGPGGAAVAAVAAGLLAGPLVPLDVSAGVPQPFEDWGSRLLFFLIIGQAAALFTARRKVSDGHLAPSPDGIAAPGAPGQGPDDEVARRQDVERAIRGVLDRRDLHLEFQPIVDLARGRVAGFEALARFDAEPSQAPEVWFARAREVGLGVDLELAAIRQAVEWANQLPAGVFVAVNLSPQTLGSARFRGMLLDVPPDVLVVEVTEHAAVEDYRALSEPVHDLRARGGRLAVDDAGAGYASLRHILRLAPDLVKLDVELTRGIDTDRARQALAAGLIAFAAELDAALIAEGIETEAELQALRSLGASLGQGYHLARPSPVPVLHLDVPASGPPGW